MSEVTEESIRERLATDKKKASRLATWAEIEFLLDRLDQIRRFVPPDGWSQFGTHANCKSAWLQFSEEVGEDGLPLWERVVTRLEGDDNNLVIWKEERDRAE